MRIFGLLPASLIGADISLFLKGAFDMDSLTRTKSIKNTPSVIIAKTVKGKGVSFMENNPGFHGKAPNKEELDRALGEIFHD